MGSTQSKNDDGPQRHLLLQELESHVEIMRKGESRWIQYGDKKIVTRANTRLNVSKLDKLLSRCEKNQVNINSVLLEKHTRTLMHLAAVRDDSRTVDVLIKHDSTKFLSHILTSDTYESPLLYAAYSCVWADNGNLDHLGSLLEAKADVNVICPGSGSSPLSCVCKMTWRDHRVGWIKETVRTLVEAKADCFYSEVEQYLWKDNLFYYQTHVLEEDKKLKKDDVVKQVMETKEIVLKRRREARFYALCAGLHPRTGFRSSLNIASKHTLFDRQLLRIFMRLSAERRQPTLTKLYD